MKLFKSLILFSIIFLSSCSTFNVPAPTPEQTNTIIPSQTATNTPTITITSTPTITNTPSLTPTQTITPTPTPLGGGSGKIAFTYLRKEFIDAFPDLEGEKHVFVAELENQKIINTRPLSEGLNDWNYILDVSPDGSKILISSTSSVSNEETDLYVVFPKLEELAPIKLAKGLPNGSGDNFPAKWINNSQLYYVGDGEEGFGIYRMDYDGVSSTATVVYKYRGDGIKYKPFEILGFNEEQIFWANKIERVEGGNRHYAKFYAWWCSVDGSVREPIMYEGEQIYRGYRIFRDDILISPDGMMIAWVKAATSLQDTGHFLNIARIVDLENSNSVEIRMPLYFWMKWFPDSSKILAFDSRLEWSKERIIQQFENIGKEMREGYFDTYGIFEMSKWLPVENYDIPDYLLVAGNKDEGVIQNNTVVGGEEINRYLNGISPDGRFAFLVYLYLVEGDNNFSKVRLLDTNSHKILYVEGFNFEYWVYNGIYWIP